MNGRTETMLKRSPALTWKACVVLAFCAVAVWAWVVVCSQSAKSNSLSHPLQGTPIGSSPQSSASAAHPLETKTAGGYLEVGFDKLSGFQLGVTYEVTNANSASFYYAPRLTNQIPSEIKNLDGKDVALKGFMLPLKGEEGRVQEFILLKNQGMCCFGKPPNLNEWVHIRMTGKGIKPLMDRIVTIYGKLHVGEYQENRQMLGIYRLDGEGIGIPAEF